MENKIIVINGCPGSGKTTISNLLKEYLNSPMIDFGSLRILHLNREWSNQSESEEQMSFENLIFILTNYIKYGYKNVIVNDLQDDKVYRITKEFEAYKYIIITLIINNDEEVKKRILGDSDRGFKNVDRAIEWNKELKSRDLYKNECRIDNSHNNPKRTLEEILNLLAKGSY